MLTEGFHEVPRGCVATIVTHLEMTEPPSGITLGALPDGLSLSAHQSPDLEWYRDLYTSVGAPWLWFSRLTQSDAALAKTLHDPKVDVFSLDVNGQAEGLLELDFREQGACELAFFGLTDALIGTGAGRWLMSCAITKAFAQDITRFHVHTCTLDSPQALGFYRKSGFTPIKQQVEIAPDPRLTGVIGRSHGTHVPILE